MIFESKHLIPTHMSISEKEQLTKLAIAKFSIVAEPAVCVEIGSYLGASATFIAAGLSLADNAGNLTCIDTWHNDAMSHVHTDPEENVYMQFRKNTQEFTRYIKTLQMDSVTAANAFKNKSVDFIFFDGDHSFNGIYGDWCAWESKLADNAIVIFHDWDWAEGVKEVILKYVKPRAKMFDTLQNMWWGYF